MIKATRSAIMAMALISVLGLLVSCGNNYSATPHPSRNEYSVMTFNLQHYSLEDRDHDGQRNDPKPIREREAIADIIAENHPDILIVQEIGRPKVFEELLSRIKAAGIAYAYSEYLRASPHENNMALLTSFPIISRQSHTNDTYSIGSSELRVARGIINVDIDIGGGYTLRVMAAHLKSKVYNPLGQTEMRRNEARILGQYVSRVLKDNPECRLLVAGDLNDNPDSAALREIRGEKHEYLADIRPVDSSRTAWTERQDGIDVYARIDYLLASKSLASDLVRSKTRIIDSESSMTASDHRPLIAVFTKTWGHSGLGAPNYTNVCE